MIKRVEDIGDSGRERYCKVPFSLRGGKRARVKLTAFCAAGLFCTAVPIIQSTAALISSLDAPEFRRS